MVPSTISVSQEKALTGVLRLLLVERRFFIVADERHGIDVGISRGGALLDDEAELGDVGTTVFDCLITFPNSEQDRRIYALTTANRSRPSMSSTKSASLTIP